MTKFTIFHAKKEKKKHSVKIEKAFLLIPGTRQESLFLLLLFSNILEVLASSIWLEKAIRHPNWTKRGKIIPVQIYLYLGYSHRSPKEFTKKLEVLEVKSYFSKVAKWKTKMQQLVSFL